MKIKQTDSIEMSKTAALNEKRFNDYLEVRKYVEDFFSNELKHFMPLPDLHGINPFEYIIYLGNLRVAHALMVKEKISKNEFSMKIVMAFERFLSKKWDEDKKNAEKKEAEEREVTDCIYHYIRRELHGCSLYSELNDLIVNDEDVRYKAREFITHLNRDIDCIFKPICEVLYKYIKICRQREQESEAKSYD